MVLYHGTSDHSGELLLASGWRPNSWPMGGQCGNPAYLYLATTPESALWYAEEKDSLCVLAIEVDVADLLVDPDDGIGETVEEELNGAMAGSLVVHRPLDATAFSRHLPAMTP